MTRRRWDSPLHFRPRQCIYLNYVEHCWYMTNINTTDVSFRAATHDYSHYWSIRWICLQSINQLETEKNGKNAQTWHNCFFCQTDQNPKIFNLQWKKKGANTNTQIWEVGARNCLALLMVVLTFTHFDFEPQLVCSAWWQMMKQDCGVSNAPLVFSWLSRPTKANFHERKVTGNQSQVSNNKKKQHHIFCIEDRKW